MSDWNPEKYLQFNKQRTQPAIDLTKRVLEYTPQSIVDIGCGPGNSTAILKKTFPNASIMGIDNSENMINKARTEHPDIQFALCSAEAITGKYDLLFSNACLQWIPNHKRLLPDLMEKLNDGGHLAVQVPMNAEEPLYRIIKQTASEGKWNFKDVFFENHDVLLPEEYFDILSGCSSQFDLWETVYYHALPSHAHLIDWVRSTRLHPYLDALDESQKQLFEQEILDKVKSVYSFTESGEIILRFRRLFFVARK